MKVIDLRNIKSSRLLLLKIDYCIASARYEKEPVLKFLSRSKFAGEHLRRSLRAWKKEKKVYFIINGENFHENEIAVLPRVENDGILKILSEKNAKRVLARNLGQIEILGKITEQEKQNIIQDNEISNLQKAVDKFSNGINKLIWTGAGLIITTIWEIIQTYFSMKG